MKKRMKITEQTTELLNELTILDIANYFESTLSIKHYQVKKINRSIYKHDFFSYQVCAIEYNKKIFKHLYNYSSVYLDRKKEKIKDFIKTPCSQINA